MTPVAAPARAKHVSAIIDRRGIPEGVEVQLLLEISYDAGKTWGQDFLDRSVKPPVCYSHKIGATTIRAVELPAGISTDAVIGTELPQGRTVVARASCSDGVAVRVAFS